eukprot:233677-Pelagomonas_calceolata.AAC.1
MIVDKKASGLLTGHSCDKEYFIKDLNINNDYMGGDLQPVHLADRPVAGFCQANTICLAETI